MPWEYRELRSTTTSTPFTAESSTCGEIVLESADGETLLVERSFESNQIGEQVPPKMREENIARAKSGALQDVDIAFP